MVGQDPSTDVLGLSCSSSEWPAALGVSASFLEVLGESVLERTVWSLVQSGINPIVVVADDTLGPQLATLPTALVELDLAHSPVDIWCVAERTLRRMAEQGIDKVLLIRAGS